MLSGIIQLIPRKTKRHSHGRPITIPLHPALKEILSEIPETEKGVFVLPEIANAYTAVRWKISQGISQIFDCANITTSVLLEGRHRKTPEATFHSLRHTFVSLAANAGVPLHIVQSIVGHESTAMTRHYYHENVDALKQAVDAIPSICDKRNSSIAESVTKGKSMNDEVISSESAEVRLCKLIRLVKKGLISQEEFAEHRIRILSEV
jgi:hypothetical protein